MIHMSDLFSAVIFDIFAALQPSKQAHGQSWKVLTFNTFESRFQVACEVTTALSDARKVRNLDLYGA